MPIYEYRCEDCGHIFEEWQKDFETHDFPCPSCGGKSERVMSNTSFILKGSGWYVTDYGKGSSTCGGNGKSAQGDSGSTSSGNGDSGNGDSAKPKGGSECSASGGTSGSSASSGSASSPAGSSST